MGSLDNYKAIMFDESTATAEKECRDRPAISLGQASEMGDLARTVFTLLANYSTEIGRGRRMNLVLPPGFGSGEIAKCVEGGIDAATPAPIGELLRVDCQLSNLALRSTLFEFLRSTFEPPVIGCGKFRVILEDEEKGIIFLLKNARRDTESGHACL